MNKEEFSKSFNRLIAYRNFKLDPEQYNIYYDKLKVYAVGDLEKAIDYYIDEYEWERYDKIPSIASIRSRINSQKSKIEHNPIYESDKATEGEFNALSKLTEQIRKMYDLQMPLPNGKLTKKQKGLGLSFEEWNKRNRPGLNCPVWEFMYEQSYDILLRIVKRQESFEQFYHSWFEIWRDAIDRYKKNEKLWKNVN